MSKARHRCAGFVCLLGIVGCQASVSSDAKMSSELTGQEPTSETPAPASSAAAAERAQLRGESQASNGDDAALSQALLGARHDFAVKDSSDAVRCKCVSAVLGPPSSGKLEWQGEMPRIKPETQLVLGLVPETSSGCQGTDSGGASYWGYKMEGEDVVVLLENWNKTRPRTLGAIIPKPIEGAQVYLAPLDSRFPYGAAVSDSGRCALGNPGPKRRTGNE